MVSLYMDSDILIKCMEELKDRPYSLMHLICSYGLPTVNQLFPGRLGMQM